MMCTHIMMMCTYTEGVFLTMSTHIMMRTHIVARSGARGQAAAASNAHSAPLAGPRRGVATPRCPTRCSRMVGGSEVKPFRCVEQTQFGGLQSTSRPVLMVRTYSRGVLGVVHSSNDVHSRQRRIQ